MHDDSKEEHKIWDVDRMSDKELENVSVDKLNWKRISALYVCVESLQAKKGITHNGSTF